MKLPVLTAVTDTAREADLVAGFERPELGVFVVRRCVDLADLLAAAATGMARAVVLSADLRRLDREALTRLRAARLAVVGLYPTGDEDAERRLRQLGLTTVLPAEATPAEVSVAVVTAVATLSLGEPEPGFADTQVALDRQVVRDELQDGVGAPLPVGQLVAVWGPTGAPGRSSVALAIAGEAAALGLTTLLIDADSYGGCQAQLTGMLEEAPGLAAACRAANAGTLDVPGLAALSRDLGGGLRLLTGISRPDRWPELRAASLEVVLEQARRLASVVVVDCGFCLEQDEELSYDTVAPRRNAATLTVLSAADTVIAVGSADPVGLHRLVRGLAELREVADQPLPTVVLNRVRTAGFAGDAARSAADSLVRHTGLAPAALIPADHAAFDKAVASGQPLGSVARGSPARVELARLTAAVVGAPAAGTRKRRGRKLSRRG